MRIAALEAAFRATTYRVETDEGVFDLRIGLSNKMFDVFLRRKDVSCWGIVTAFNPGGIRSDDANLRCHHQLLEKLQASSWIYLPACNLADDEAWPDEHGFLILQASEKEVCNLAAERCQLACVCGDVGTLPRLVWT